VRLISAKVRGVADTAPLPRQGRTRRARREGLGYRLSPLVGPDSYNTVRHDSVLTAAAGAQVYEHFAPLPRSDRTAGLLDALVPAPMSFGRLEFRSTAISYRQDTPSFRYHRAHDVAVHAALQATIDALFQGADLSFAPRYCGNWPHTPISAPRRAGCRPSGDSSGM